ncbi:hypothetical protein L3Q72_11715 [Vibrio sp. JC009]|uniref:hypothetical protein n=1 Tax=Vibrio sp. JC009 TaxID=2912314 RepID=UPI0023B0BF8D|nr:hypothetical protein [Vibrio sp. JC009]WED21300.1 hypothetical protein L3Q72_11715 [Vibrio sp. JC009]
MTKKQSGMAILLTTSLLLTAALALTMVSYKGVFFQIKLTQNHLQSSREFWIAEAGLECAFGALKTGRAIVDISEGCRLEEALFVTLTELEEDRYRIFSRYLDTQICRSVQAERNTGQIVDWSWIEGSWNDF